MADWIFYLFAGLTLVSGLLVVVNPFSRNPVTSAMFLVLTMVFLAGLFVLLQAFFLAAVQILVYAGAVMVLFLFVVMLLDLPEEERSRYRRGLTVLATVAMAALVGLLLKAASNSDLPPAFGDAAAPGDPLPLGRLLFTEYLLPFEIVSVLLLVAMIGVILLSRREPK